MSKSPDPKPLPVRKPYVAHDNELRVANERGIRPAQDVEQGRSNERQ